MILSAQSIRRRCIEISPPLIAPFVERGVSPGGKTFGLDRRAMMYVSTSA
jgi:hypothetical protein